jgi:hypothetical protein
VAEALKEALGEHKCYRTLDAFSGNGSGTVMVTVLPEKDYGNFPAGVGLKTVQVGTVHSKHFKDSSKEHDDFGHVIFCFFGRALADGRFTGHPQTLIDWGLEGIGEGLKLLSEGKASATKYPFIFSYITYKLIFLVGSPPVDVKISKSCMSMQLAGGSW